MDNVTGHDLHGHRPSDLLNNRSDSGNIFGHTAFEQRESIAPQDFTHFTFRHVILIVAFEFCRDNRTGCFLLRRHLPDFTLAIALQF